MRADEIELRLAWEQALGRSPAARSLHDRLVERHREPHRRYHDLRHVGWVVRHVRELASSEPVDDLDAVIVAAWFHDAVHQGRPGDDERASADLARRELTQLAIWQSERIDRVAQLVLATAHLTDRPDPVIVEPGAAEPGTAHPGVADAHNVGSDAAVLIDADLGVLAAPPAAYLDYARGVRAEHPGLDENAWRTGRSAVLRSLLDRPSIFVTPTARTRWEPRARANLSAELATLAPHAPS